MGRLPTRTTSLVYRSRSSGIGSSGSGGRRIGARFRANAVGGSSRRFRRESDAPRRCRSAHCAGARAVVSTQGERLASGGRVRPWWKSALHRRRTLSETCRHRTSSVRRVPSTPKNVSASVRRVSATSVRGNRGENSHFGVAAAPGSRRDALARSSHRTPTRDRSSSIRTMGGSAGQSTVAG